MSRSLRPLTLVGLGRFELPTSPLSGVRSNHLSYRPNQMTEDVATTPQGQVALSGMQVTCADARKGVVSKGGDPAAPSDTATLLRLHPSHEPLRGRRPPCG